MELAMASIFSNLLDFQFLKGDIDNLMSAVQFLLETLSNLWMILLQITQLPFDSKHVSSCNSESRGDEIMSVSEVNVVMHKLGMEIGSVDSEEMGFGTEAFESLFEEEEPSLEEIRMSFGVFDLNKDGYIDAVELQRVVCELGLKGSCGLEEYCERMIRAFDSNGDGLIDFADFVNLMEKSLS